MTKPIVSRTRILSREINWIAREREGERGRERGENIARRVSLYLFTRAIYRQTYRGIRSIITVPRPKPFWIRVVSEKPICESEFNRWVTAFLTDHWIFFSMEKSIIKGMVYFKKNWNLKIEKANWNFYELKKWNLNTNFTLQIDNKIFFISLYIARISYILIFRTNII